MAFAGDERGYAFLCDWFDNQSQTIRKFTLTYYAATKSVEMWDLTGKRMFFKKCQSPNVFHKEIIEHFDSIIYWHFNLVIGDWEILNLCN